MQQEQEETTELRVGFVGKLPAQADFVRQHVSDRIGGEFDKWLVKSTQAMLSARAALPPGGVRFVFSAAQCDSVAIGVLVASRDHVGREFPLAVYTTLPAALAARHALGLPLAYLQFLDAAEEVVASAVDGSAAELRARAAALLPPPQEIVVAAAQQCWEVMGQTQAGEMLGRVFAQVLPGGSLYALHTFMVAAEGARAAAGSAPTVLDCPITTDVDLAAWIDLGRRGVASSALCPTFAWVQVNPRLLLVLGHAPEQLLHFVADPKHKSSRLWPLTTERMEAIERARGVLNTQLGSADGALTMSLEALWNQLLPARS
ncbi:MAG TPA: type VI secretion system-associated protein TagF [Polyangiales bacterium]|nr:type VI secretion system-associated protein TagF [Polyangiales bacterium]